MRCPMCDRQNCEHVVNKDTDLAGKVVGEGYAIEFDDWFQWKYGMEPSRKNIARKLQDLVQEKLKKEEGK